MISSLKIKLFFIGALLFTLSCDGELDSLVNERLENNPVPDTTVNANAGSADFSNFITIGNSLTAGFMDAALYNLGQNNSLGAQIAAQLAPAGAPGTFNQPDIASERGFNTSVPNPQNGTVLGRFKLDTNIPGPSPTIGGDPIGAFSGDASALDNYGVPGILLGQLLTPATGGPQTSPLFNPFYQRFASAPGSSTIIGDAVVSEPTFFTLWIGNNDVLAYALSGATQDQLLTNPQDFQQQFGQVINTLMTETSASGVVGTIPPVLGIPFFQAVPYNSVVLDQQTADQLNQGLATLNAVYDGMAESSLVPFTEEDRDQRAISYEAGANPVLIKDPNLEDIGNLFDLLLSVGQINEEQRASLEPFRQARPMVVDDAVGPELLTLSAASVLGTLADPNNPQSQIGVVIPLEPQFHLTASNIVEIETARQTFNAMIKGTVDNVNQAQEATRLGIYDANAPDGSFADLLGLVDGDEPGIEIQGTMLQPDFSPNGVFSTDGVHPNPRGTALLANEFITAIEETFGAEIPEVDVLRLPSTQTCNGDCVSQQGKVVSGQAQRILPGNLFK